MNLRFHIGNLDKHSVSPGVPPPPGPDASSEEIDAYFTKYSWSQIEKAGHMHQLTDDEMAWVNEISEECGKRVDARQSRTQLNLALPADQLARFTEYAQKKTHSTFDASEILAA